MAGGFSLKQFGSSASLPREVSRLREVTAAMFAAKLFRLSLSDEILQVVTDLVAYDVLNLARYGRGLGGIPGSRVRCPRAALQPAPGRHLGINPSAL